MTFQKVRGARRYVCLAAVCALLVAVTPLATARTGGGLRLNAKSGILIDYANGKVLYEKNADMPIPPASLTKMMTMHLAYKALEAGTLHRDDVVTITREMTDMPRGSSLMPLMPGERVTVKQLMLGMAIVSGNDAAYALAIHMAGSADAFAEMMNAEARAMGYRVMHFVEPSGISEKNIVTAREYADFCRRYLIMHPESIEELHSVRQLDFPLTANMSPEHVGPVRTLHQQNRNALLWDYPGCDGLKTGYIIESGYNIALTAKRGTTRLVAVTLGGPGHGYAGGYRIRALDGEELLDYGFRNFVTLTPRIEKMAPVRVWKGTLNAIVPVPAESLDFTVSKDETAGLKVAVEKRKSVVAPVPAGTELGALVYTLGGREVRRVPLVAGSSIARGGLFKRLWDGIRMIFMG